MLRLDGSKGEGGGQILRSSLSLAMATGQPFCIEKIRAGRAKPGLLRQHLTAVLAAAEVSRADVEGAQLGSQRLTFRPKQVHAGDYSFAIGSAGSTTLVLQTLLPALWSADGPTQVAVEGGTHNPHAPPFDFLAKTYLPLLARMGVQATARLDRPGFYPAGGGRIVLEVQPTAGLHGFEIFERGRILRRRATAYLANLSGAIAERELAKVQQLTGWRDDELAIRDLAGSRGPGNVLSLEIESTVLTEVFTGFGERGVSAETVAENAVDEWRRCQRADVPVGEHLADQLLLPLALAGGGGFCTHELSRHSTTQSALIRQFLDLEPTVRQTHPGRWQVCIGKG